MTSGATPPAFVDVDETRDDPLPHRYLHGGFEGTETRFSVYYPPPASWRGRFFSSIEGGPGGRETRAAAGEAGPGSLAFARAMGAYLVETNSGHRIVPGRPASRGSGDPKVTSYGANADAARWAREFAKTVYGSTPRYGYVFGPSGGAWRTVLCVENTDVWDGSVPFISGMGGGVNFPSLVANVARMLGPDLASVVDAHDPGGSGDPFARLTGPQRLELARLYRSGLQPGAEFSLLRSELEFRVMRIVGSMHDEFDPTYVDDFWTVRGHAGADGELDDVVIDEDVTITRIVRAEDRGRVVAIVVDPDPDRDARGAIVRARGEEATIVGRIGEALAIDVASGDRLDGVVEGETVHISNRRYLAFCLLYRYQVDPEYAEAAQLLVAGAPMYPQRPVSVAHALTGVPLTGRFHGKMIYVANLKDTATSPVSGAIGYRSRVRRAGGTEAEARLRTWLIDNASHADGSRLAQGPPPVTSTRLIDWGGCVERALTALIGWVENAAEPPPDTGFTYDDGRVRLAGRAAERRGIQPTVVLRANGAERTEVRAGTTVTFEVAAEAAPGPDRLLGVEWDFQGTGVWSAQSPGRGALLVATAAYTYERPGTYFPSVRVTAHPGPPVPEWCCRIHNLGRARVVVG